MAKWKYIADYACGCTDEARKKGDLLDYCGQHGDDRRYVYKVPADDKTKRMLDEALNDLDLPEDTP